MGDIYCLFYEKGLQILKPGGYLCFITSNNGCVQAMAKRFVTFFLTTIQLFSLILVWYIESATVDTNILLIQKAQNQKELKAVTLKRKIMKSGYRSTTKNSWSSTYKTYKRRLVYWE
jgi:hypothetical protein